MIGGEVIIAVEPVEVLRASPFWQRRWFSGGDSARFLPMRSDDVVTKSKRQVLRHADLATKR